MLEVEPQTRFPTYGSLLGDMKRYLSKAGPIRMEKSSKRIVLKGKRGVTGKVSATGMLSTTGSVTGNVDELPPGMTPVEAIEEVQESEEDAGKRGCRMMGLILGGVVALLVVLGLIVFGVIKHSERKKANAEQTQIVIAQEKARTSIATAVANAKGAVEKIQGFVPEAMGYPKAAADEVVKALGEEVRASMVPPEPDENAVAAAADDKQAAPADAPPLDPARLAELTKLLPPEAAKMLEGFDKLSPDQMLAKLDEIKLDEIAKALPAEQVASLTNNLATLKAMMAGGMAAALTNAPVQTEQPAQPAAAEAAQDDAHPVIAIVRGMYVDAYSVKSAAALAGKKLQEVEQKAKEAEQSRRLPKGCGSDR